MSRDRRRLRDKQRAYRQRRRRDRAVFKAEASWVAMTELLSNAGLLAEWDSEDRVKVQESFQAFMDTLLPVTPRRE